MPIELCLIAQVKSLTEQDGHTRCLLSGGRYLDLYDGMAGREAEDTPLQPIQRFLGDMTVNAHSAKPDAVVYGFRDYSPIALMRALLVHTWRPCGANGREPAAGWALGTIFPDFDNLARPIKRRINHAVVAALPIAFRPALLAGVSRVIGNPEILNMVRDDTILRGRRAFERLCETARLEAEVARESH